MFATTIACQQVRDGRGLAGVFGVEETDGIDWIRWLISVVVAVILLCVGGALFRKS